MRKIIEFILRLFGHHKHHKKGCHPEYKGKGNHPDFPNDRPVHGSEGRFDHHWYLKTYQDVAKDKCYHDKPYAHYIGTGHKEGRKRYPGEGDIVSIKGSFSGNWVFAPQEFNGDLWLPVSDNGGTTGDCFVYRFNDGKWSPSLNMKNTEDLCRLVPHKGDLVTMPETNDGIRSLHDGQWRMDFNYRGKPDQYGTFDGTVVGDHLWTSVTGYDTGTPIMLLKRIGFRNWHTFEFSPGIPGQRATIWSIGTNGRELFAGVAGFGRGISENTSMDGIWNIDMANPENKIREAPIKAQAFCKYDDTILAGATGGGVYKRTSGGWRQCFGLNAKVVVSIMQLGEYTYCGTALPGLLYRGKGLDQPKLIKKCGEAVRVGLYKGRACAAWYDGNIINIDWV